MSNEHFATGFRHPILHDPGDVDHDKIQEVGTVTVCAMGHATVVEVGMSQGGVVTGYGNFVVLRHDLPQPVQFGGQSHTFFHTLFANLDSVYEMAVGQHVRIGQPIGTMRVLSSDPLAELNLEVAVGKLRLAVRSAGADQISPLSFIEDVNLALAGAYQAQTGISYLSSAEIPDVLPFQRPFSGDQDVTVPDVLNGIFFHQPMPTDEEIARYGGVHLVPTIKTYAVLDAAQMPFLLTGLLETSGLRYQSLFQGETQAELEETAPYLVELEDGAKFTQSLFLEPTQLGGLWGRDLGVFIRSRLSFDVLRNHLRKFTRIQDENGKWFYFKFWDPKNFFVTSSMRSEARSPFVRVWANPSIFEVLFPAKNSMGVVKVEHHLPSGLGAIRLRNRDIEAIKNAKRHQFLHRVARTLEADHADLWQTTGYEEIEKIYVHGCSRKYTIEKAAYDFIRGHLLARKRGYVFDQVEAFIDPQTTLAPLKRGARIWDYLTDEKGNP